MIRLSTHCAAFIGMVTVDPSNPQTTGDACNFFIAQLYKQKFAKHTQGETLDEILLALQNSKLSQRIKDQLPSLARVEVTMRNINWLLVYWECRSVADNMACYVRIFAAQLPIIRVS